MIHSLIAPQFGLVDDRDHLRKKRIDEAGPEHCDTLTSPLPSQAGPTVVVKRRRLLEAGALNGPADAHEASLPAVKAPKIYRVDSPAAADPVATGQSTASPMAATEPPVAPSAVEQAPAGTPRRRQRDPQRSPGRVSHTVFEVFERTAHPAAVANAEAEYPVSLLPSGAPADYEAVCRALERAQEELNALRHARRLRLLIGKSRL